MMTKHNTPRTCLFTFILALMVANHICAADEDANRVALLEEVATKVRKLLPASWEVTITPSADDFSGSDEPALVVRTKQPVATLTQYPNPAPGQKPLAKEVIVSVRFECRPFVSQEAHANATKRNLAMRDERLAFAAKHLSKVQTGYMGNPPIPPGHHTPENAEQQRAVLEYAFLWLRTVPEELPSHHYRNLSFDRNYAFYTTMADPAKAKEFNKLLDKLDEILTPYAKAAQ